MISSRFLFFFLFILEIFETIPVRNIKVFCAIISYLNVKAVVKNESQIIVDIRTL